MEARLEAAAQHERMCEERLQLELAAAQQEAKLISEKEDLQAQVLLLQDQLAKMREGERMQVCVGADGDRGNIGDEHSRCFGSKSGSLL